MAYSEFLADKVRQHLGSGGLIEEKKMMGGLVFMVNQKMCIGIDQDKQTKEDRLMVRVGKQAYNDLLQRKGCREMDFPVKSMKGFLFVYPEGYDHQKDLEFWVEKALEFNKIAAKSK